MNMDKVVLCRLCLTNGGSTSFVSNTAEIELVLQRFNILFEVRVKSKISSTSIQHVWSLIFILIFQKRDLSSSDSLSILKELCDLCWQKVDEFNQFCMQVDNIQASYNRQFHRDDGQFAVFEDSQQYYLEVEKIHNEFASKMQLDDKKSISYIEPFCIINVDDAATKMPNDTRHKVNEYSLKGIESMRIKQERETIGDNCDDELNKADILHTESMTGFSDCDDDMSYVFENEDEEDDDADGDDDDNFSSDTSYSESNKKWQKTTGKSAKSKKLPNEKKFGGKSSTKSKRPSKKFSVTTVNVLDENNKRLLSYVQMKCDVCSDDRVFDSFSEIQTHFLDIHNQTGYVMCCNRKFRRIGRVLQHCTWHDNPEAFKCDTCNKCFQDNVCLRDHITSMHIPVDERRYQCEQCSRLFAKQHLLNTHLKMKHTVKEERPFVCTEGECGQRFVLPAYLRLHIEKVHNKSDSR